jgi:hypothetical protein
MSTRLSGLKYRLNADFAARVFEILKPTRLVVYGTPSVQVKEALAGANPVYMAPLEGFRK